MKITEADVIWVPDRDYNTDAPNRGEIRVEKHLSGWQRTRGDRWMPATSLGAMDEVSTKGDPIKQLLAMFILFNTVTVRDGIDAAKAHQAFLAIDEYRKTISPDAPGAEVSAIDGWERRSGGPGARS
jgi:hypothetical protein